MSAHNVGDLGSIPGSERCPGEGSGNPLQYSCLENPMDRGVRVTVHFRERSLDDTYPLNFVEVRLSTWLSSFVDVLPVLGKSI